MTMFTALLKKTLTEARKNEPRPHTKSALGVCEAVTGSGASRAAASLLRYNNSEELKEDLNSLRNNLDNVLFSLDLDSLELPEPELDIDFDTDFEFPELIL